MTISSFLLVMALIAFSHFLLLANKAASNDRFMKKVTYWYLFITTICTLGLLLVDVLKTFK